jgi:hypothetical protein
MLEARHHTHHTAICQRLMTALATPSASATVQVICRRNRGPMDQGNQPRPYHFPSCDPPVGVRGGGRCGSEEERRRSAPYSVWGMGQRGAQDCRGHAPRGPHTNPPTNPRTRATRVPL